MVPRTNQLLNVAGLALNDTGTGTALQVPKTGDDDRMYVTVQANITGTLNVVIQGREDSLSQWVTLFTFTTTDVQLITRTPQMRATYNGASAGAAGLVQIDKYCKVAG